jgi:hypothetical protein
MCEPMHSIGPDPKVLQRHTNLIIDAGDTTQCNPEVGSGGHLTDRLG